MSTLNRKLHFGCGESLTSSLMNIKTEEMDGRECRGAIQHISRWKDGDEQNETSGSDNIEQRNK